MKKFFCLLLACTLLLATPGCEESGKNVDDKIEVPEPEPKPEPVPEGEKIASIEEQIKAIANSLPELKATIVALNNLANALSLNNMALETRSNNDSNNGVKTQIENLEKRIEELEKYIANGGGIDQEWLDATYATLEKYEETIAVLAALQTEVNALKEYISNSNYELFAEVDNRIRSSCESMKEWISEQLSGYYNIAAIDSLFAQMEAALTEESAELRDTIEEMRSSISETLGEMREEYKVAIAEAINEFHGVITAEIAAEIEAVNERIDGEINNLNKRLDELEARLDELENAVTNLINRIQSITYVPAHEDGRARVECPNTSTIGSTITMDFIISPKNAVTDIVERFEEILTLKANIVGTTSHINIPITDCSSDADNGVLTITASGDDLGDDFFYLKTSARVMLTISDGNNDRNTEYIPLFPRFHKQAENMIFYTSTDEKIIEPKWNGETTIIANIYDDNYGVLVFEDWLDVIPNLAFANNARLSSITLPEKVNTIEEKAFADCSALQRINIPEKVSYIGKYAFQNCYAFPEEDGLRYADTYLIEATQSQATYNLKENTRFIGEAAFKHRSIESIVIPDGVVVITEESFAYSSLASITIPNSVRYIEERAFSDCRNLTSITIPDSVWVIGEYAFETCDNLTDVTIGCGVISIREGAFSGCSSLTSITIPDSVTSIGESAFFYCSNLTSVTIDNGVLYIEEWAFSDCDNLKSINIPDSVVSIGQRAFQRCSSLESVTLGNSITSIGQSAFSDCRSLTSISIPNSVTSIGGGAFAACSSLTSISIPNSVTSIGADTFSDCRSLTNVTIGNGTTSIGDNAFSGCESLTNITIPNGVTSIGVGAFAACSSLTSITIPNSVTSIGREAFYFCSSLTSITIPDSVVEIGDQAFSNCVSLAEFKGNLASDDGYCLIINGVLHTFAPAATPNEYIIPDGVTSIGVGAFSGCSDLTSITIPDSVVLIGKHAFWLCSSLASINIPDGVTSIGNYAFYDCENLLSITIPESVTWIGDCAFCGDFTKSIYVKSKTPIKAPATLYSWYPFGFPYVEDFTIYVPTESVNVYKTDLWWKYYADYIVGYDFE